MPRVKKNAKPARKRKRATNKIVQKNSTSVGTSSRWSMRMPFKPSFACVMKYAETFTITTGTLGVLGTAQQMRLNNLHDPNLTGTGHQPYGYDQITPLYKGYRVYAVKATLIWSTIGGTADMLCCYTYQGNVGGLTLDSLTVDQATERPYVNTIMLSASGNTRTVEQNVYLPLHKVFGVSKKEFEGDPNYEVETLASTAVPVNQAYLSFSAGSPSGVASQTCTVQCVLHYYVVWHGMQIQAQS